MKIEKFDFESTGQFSSLFLDYINKNDSLSTFYSNYPDLAGFGKQMELKKDFGTDKRTLLVKCLQEQYRSIEANDAVRQNIELLKNDKTFTVTTGHQLNIFTGPLYFIYKIVTAINTCKQLKSEYPGYNFVPVYWMASEDHDFEEISYFNLFGNKYTWESDQSGAVGRMDPGSVKAVLDAMPGKNEMFRKAYLEHDTLAAAVLYYVNELFGYEGLVVIDADIKELKNIFRQVVKDELTKSSSFELVNTQTKLLEEIGYKPQLRPREINLFYLDENLRERIIKEGDLYKVVGNEQQFTEKEILKLVDKEPIIFSPNVILRPLYQEMILPNLAYIGGPAEVVYWLQLKLMFEYFQVPFPILLPRNFVLYINHVVARKMDKTGANTPDVFLNEQELIHKLVSNVAKNGFTVDKEKAKVAGLFAEVHKQVLKLDPTLEKLVMAEAKRAENSLGKIEKKAVRAIVRQNEDLT
ncbi:MAG: bacillithiol biosynthesis cysteine-adding enzyme BshC, partial [Thiohalomonadales bacterium]